MLTVEVDVAKGLPTGIRDISIRQSNALNPVAVYDKVSYISITPNAGMSRLGGVRYPKQFAGFDAMAFASGSDGKPHTPDDVALGPVTAKWALEEFQSTPDDDDTKYVGNIDDSGLFTPNVEGPNPERKKQPNNFGTNNFGDVWVTASYTMADGTVLQARSYLVVTVPLYTIYDQPEVGQ
jgi:quinohemoprotein amine dehydrogenase